MARADEPPMEWMIEPHESRPSPTPEPSEFIGTWEDRARAVEAELDRLTSELAEARSLDLNGMKREAYAAGWRARRHYEREDTTLPGGGDPTDPPLIRELARLRELVEWLAIEKREDDIPEEFLWDEAVRRARTALGRTDGD